MDIAVKKTPIGVIVGRFQVDELHEGHRNLIDSVIENHDKVIIFLGVSPAINTETNPMDYKPRELMLLEAYPQITVIPIKDVNNDLEWSKTLDTKIREVFPMGSITLYGSRDGFTKSYKGNLPTIQLQDRFKISGSEIRKSLSTKVISNKFYRQGLIAAAFMRYPVSMTTVDAAIMDGKGSLLLARKKIDPKGKWRFIGGFVDIHQDISTEDAVKREVMEETGSLGVGEPEYIGSARIEDWRYRNERDGIMTTFFAIPYTFGKPEATDDIDEIKWFDIKQLIQSEGFVFVEEHKVLYNLLKNYLEKKETK
jgi:bifunctional NMN adenylyltransferase/nudix hydrolase